MASPTQTVVGKGISNPLTAEDLLKILRDLFPFDSLSKITYQFSSMECKTTQKSFHPFRCYVNIKPMTVISSFLSARTRPLHAMFNSIPLASISLLS